MRNSKGWRYGVKRVLPPALADLLRGKQIRTPITWDGIYPSLAAVPVERGSYGHEARVAEFVARVVRAREQAAAGRKLDVANAWHEALTLLTASLAATQHSVHILDFGGGTGLGYVQLMSCLKTDTTVSYDVVDLEEMCAAGRELFRDDPHIQFHTAIASFGNAPDIVYASTVLPYIEDYAGLLKRLAALRGRFLLLNQLAAGKNPTYAARQVNLPGQTLAYWFLNRDEVVSLLRTEGYLLTHEDFVGPEYDQSNYPETHRIGRMRSMLFTRADLKDSEH